jgi:hypothetical protein
MTRSLTGLLSCRIKRGLISPPSLPRTRVGRKNRFAKNIDKRVFAAVESWVLLRQQYGCDPSSRVCPTCKVTDRRGCRLGVVCQRLPSE